MTSLRLVVVVALTLLTSVPALAQTRGEAVEQVVERAHAVAPSSMWSRAASRAQASEDTLWLLYSNTKVVTACAVWLLVERGALSFTDKVAEHLPGFEQNGKGDITIIQLLTHQGGFPNAQMPKAAWADHDLMRRTVCAFTLEWTPGSRAHYHGLTAHWTAAALIEAVTKTDYRDFYGRLKDFPLPISRETGALLGSIPVAFVYSFFVEHYVSGVTGAVKG